MNTATIKKISGILWIILLLFFTLGNEEECGEAPSLFIISPEQNGSYPDIRPVSLEAYAVDYEDGTVPDKELNWQLPSPYDIIVTGPKHDFQFPVGDFELEFFAVDTEGNISTETILFSVFPATDEDGDGYCIEELCKPEFWDCNDHDASIHPGAIDICDGLDNDCDEETDENCVIDEDGDSIPANMDCDDNNPAVYPGAPEICDSIDNNCNEEIDENFFLLGSSCSRGLGICLTE